MPARRSSPSEDQLRSLSPETFAGTWLDSSGRLVVAYSNSADEQARQAQQHLGLSRKVTVIEHARSLRELESIQASVDQRESDLAAAGTTLYAIDIDVIGNVVEVTIDPLTSAVQALLRDRYGDAVKVYEGRVELV